MKNSDTCVSFYLDEGAFRGHLCRLSHSISSALENHQYPQKINTLLAEIAAISQCFTMDIKSSSQATMQLTGTTPIRLALVNSQSCESFRCCATLNSETSKNIINYENLSIPQLFGQNGKLVFTIEFDNQYYQTIISLDAPTLQECFQHYFIQSQQIPTIIVLYSTAENNKIESAALLLQKVANTPNILDENSDKWHDISCFAASIKPHELLSSGPPIKRLIELLFHELKPVVSRETILSFKCTCSEERITNIIKNLESQDANEFPLEVICEYCNKKYTIDKKQIDS